ncbi:hypothetical protein SASPL_127666 [Salvia splendens]|uniref:SWIM-type domain-containing protein n=2 Tax=Salvia splendens TaxID=180675 RepID=A0A8X8XCC2_SALSN|nr:uncharacterized protein LOC121751881 isoform X1 [Salvia splendens]XP_042002619.1 uncharacterized protein LOC121751881 isoform X1 [Salvia splendens]XP_042002620.1 uncharacterized protein LOC121751881 isoform X1 [Salvia splendens]XP_042002621.1 uncharacterized protein LOC121751881 isoform X1 [Salvia splendens]XP_042002622.1 uncharacterized protein LOC121751881 isoform X1 [Salvia splendens]KAG6409625.1 hypothetical protein SASPL_127666 [Salvia splendens]
MKSNEAKMARMEDILNLPVQDPPYSEFSAAHINWFKVEGGRQGGDDIALIPFSRVDDFVKSESSNADCPARFRVESRRKRPEGSLSRPRVDGYLEYTLYWCSYGPEDYRDVEPHIGENSSIKPASGKGSRPGRRHMMRGCLCHFTVKRLYTRPLLALIIYNQRNHVDKTGAPCHGILDQEAVGTRAMYAPRISEELRQKVMAMLHVGVSLDTIVQHHMEEVQRHGGPHIRDDFLTRNDVRNMERLIRNASHDLHSNVESSVKIWAQRHHKHVFYFEESSGSETFVLGLQTDWQLQQMLRYGHSGSIALHTVSGSKRLKDTLCSLLAFDSSHNAVPVAWIITSTSPGNTNTHKWMLSLVERLRGKDTRWRPYAILVDDPSFQLSVIREAFQCRILLCLWHVRRGWLKSLLKHCHNFDVQREMFKHLGRILYCTGNVSSTAVAVEEFLQIYVDQSEFVEYFRSKWLPKLDLWFNCVRTLPVAGLEHYASIESYHLRLKSRVLSLLAEKSHRIDLLVHALTTQFHSFYWFDTYIVETGYFENLRDRFSLTNPWYQAVHISDMDVLLDVENLQFAKVASQADSSMAYTLWNPGSEFGLCDCSWSMVGNMCKHTIKVAIYCRSRQIARPLLSAQVYRQTLLSLLQNLPDDPLVLGHAISLVNRMKQDIKNLEDLSNSGLLQPVSSGTNSILAENIQPLPRIN